MRGLGAAIGLLLSPAVRVRGPARTLWPYVVWGCACAVPAGCFLLRCVLCGRFVLGCATLFGRWSLFMVPLWCFVGCVVRCACRCRAWFRFWRNLLRPVQGLSVRACPHSRLLCGAPNWCFSRFGVFGRRGFCCLVGGGCGWRLHLLASPFISHLGLGGSSTRSSLVSLPCRSSLWVALPPSRRWYSEA